MAPHSLSSSSQLRSPGGNFGCHPQVERLDGIEYKKLVAVHCSFPICSETYLQSNTVRLEEMKVKRRDAEQWMSHCLLPENLRERMRRCQCLKKMDEQLLDAMCDRLKPAFYTTEESYIVREGDPVDEMLFIMRGKLLTVTTNGGRTGF
ncbi:hypothetical protein IFM89_028989 [Coptis chinensis]|uniref:Cyclic nucleotide-binding domain-containing protein n=1 Tax=Coptis chinensis TaxID=261450 RepID=A0A835IIA0_9MAGN|nr:hypothetical protein IFM89_028989 [Coptis chinensis]